MHEKVSLTYITTPPPGWLLLSVQNGGKFLCPQRNFGRHIVIALSVLPSHYRVRSISPIFFEVGIPNLVCGCILDGEVSRTIFGSL